jgi:hypothetical protein
VPIKRVTHSKPSTIHKRIASPDAAPRNAMFFQDLKQL